MQLNNNKVMSDNNLLLQNSSHRNYNALSNNNTNNILSNPPPNSGLINVNQNRGNDDSSTCSKQLCDPLNLCMMIGGISAMVMILLLLIVYK